MNKYVITVTRQFGSMGRPIAKKLAQRLGINYYDRDIVDMTAKKLNVPVSVISELDRKSTAETKPSPKPAAIEVKLLDRSDQNAPRSIIVWSPSNTTGIKGKLFPVRLPRESRYQTTNAAQNEISSHSLSLIPFFLVFPFI